MPKLIDAIYLDPQQAIEQVAGKDVRVTWDWREMVGNEHNRAFTIAKMTRVDLLNDIKAALRLAIKEGLTGKEARDLLAARMRASGWWGRRNVRNPKTGQVTEVRLGTPWRIDTIVRTNTQAAFMSGKWRRFYQNKDNRPYLEYVAVLDGSTRDSHRRLSGYIAHIDAPEWGRIFPPNGYNCRCRVRALTEKQATDRANDVKIPSKFPDPGFSGNPGRVSDVDSVNLFYRKAVKAGNMSAFRDFVKDPIRLRFLEEIGLPAISATGGAFLLNVLGPRENPVGLSVNKVVPPAVVPDLLQSVTVAPKVFLDTKTGRVLVLRKGTKHTYFIFSASGRYIKSGIVLRLGKRYRAL